VPFGILDVVLHHHRATTPYYGSQSPHHELVTLSVRPCHTQKVEPYLDRWARSYLDPLSFLTAADRVTDAVGGERGQQLVARDLDGGRDLGSRSRCKEQGRREQVGAPIGPYRLPSLLLR